MAPATPKTVTVVSATQDPAVSKDTEAVATSKLPDSVKYEGPVPFPRSPEEIRKRKLPEAETLAIWARQEKQGIITLCNHKSDDGKQRCYFPASNVRDESGQPLFEVDAEGRTYAVGICSYARELHPMIKMYPPKKEDEI